MKRAMLVFFAVCSVSISVLASTGALICKESVPSGARELEVETSAALDSAQVRLQSLLGPEIWVDLLCSIPADEDNGQIQTEKLKTILVCSESGLVNTGYSFNVTEGGLIGGTNARLSKVTMFGTIPVADFSCSPKP